MAGRVSPTTNINGMPVNDNAALEHEADVMGEKAVTQRMENINTGAILKNSSYLGSFDTVQKVKISGGVSRNERNNLITLGIQVWTLNNRCENDVGKYVLENVLPSAEKNSIRNLKVSYGKNKYQAISRCAPVVIKAFNEGLYRVNYNNTLNILNGATIALNRIVGYCDEYTSLMGKVNADYRRYCGNTKLNRGFNNFQEIETSGPIYSYIVGTTRMDRTADAFYIADSFHTGKMAFHRVVQDAQTFVWHLWPVSE